MTASHVPVTAVIHADRAAARRARGPLGAVLSVLGVVLFVNSWISLVVVIARIGAAVTGWAAPDALRGVPATVSVVVSVVFYAVWLVANKKIVRHKPLLWALGRMGMWLTVAGLKISHALFGRPYWSQLDDGIVLGSLPFEADAQALVRQGVRHVVNLCEEYEGPVHVYAQHGVRHLYIPVIDYLPPTLHQLQAGVDAIAAAVARGEGVYVHCKAGQGRSATVVLCYLIEHKKMTAQEGIRYLKSKRPKVSSDIYRRPVVVRYAQMTASARRQLSAEAQVLLASGKTH